MSNSDLNKHKKHDKIKWIATALAGIILAGACATSLAMGIKNNGWFEKDTEQVQPSETDKAFEAVGGGAEVTTHNTEAMAMSARLASSDDGIATLSENSYSLTASIYPTNADNKLVDWSIAWSNSASTWANGKKVTDYVTLTPTSDGALTANLACKAAFAEQIIVTCTSRDSSTVKATATVDYRKKITSITSTLPTTSGVYTWDTSGNVGGYTVAWSIGTIEDTVKTTKATVTASTALRTVLGNDSHTKSYSDYYTADRSALLSWNGYFTPKDGDQYDWDTPEGLFGWVGEAYDYGIWNINSTRYNYLRTDLLSASNDLAVTIALTTESGATSSATYNVNISDSVLNVKAESVSLSSSKFVF